jgi:hypothetical protein
MTSFISKFGKFIDHDSLYSNDDVDIPRESSSEEYTQDTSQDTIFDFITECYAHDFKTEKRKGVQFSMEKNKEYPERIASKEPINIPIEINDHYFFRKSFDIVNKRLSLKKQLKIWKLKREYRSRVSKNIFCGNQKLSLHQEFETMGELTMMYRFESWSNYNGIFGAYKSKNKTFIFYMYKNDTNMYIDIMTEDINKFYLNYLKKIFKKTAGDIYYKEKFNINYDINTKEELFNLVQDVKDQFVMRNCLY